MKELLHRLEKHKVQMNGIEVVPFSIIREELERQEELSVIKTLSKIQQDVNSILGSISEETNKILND